MVGQVIGIEVEVVAEVGVEEEETLPGDVMSLPLFDSSCLRQSFFTEASFCLRTASSLPIAGRK